MTIHSPDLIAEAVARQYGFAKSLFDELEMISRDEPGLTRATYSEVETRAHLALAAHARGLGLSVTNDAALNTYMTLPGATGARKVIVGSHLDSIPHGGNFDGAAGVVAGLIAAAVLKSLKIVPACDLDVMAIRAEESVWFEVSYIGSRAALGTLPSTALSARRIDTGRTLADHIVACGGDPLRIQRSEAHLRREQIEAFIEIHIEQAPSLQESGFPIGVCTGIPGNFRYPNAVILGENGHVGLPRRFRRDCVMAAAELAVALDQAWQEAERAGHPMAVTLGRFHTDTRTHGLTVVPGSFHFCLDVRSPDAAFLSVLERRFEAIIADIEKRRGVKFQLGTRASVAPGVMDPAIVDGLKASISELGIKATSLTSPASHDAAAFAAAGVPTGMLFVRNENGSHHALESMQIDDLLEAAKVLTWWLITRSHGNAHEGNRNA